MKKLGAKGIKILKILHIFFAMTWMSGALGMAYILCFADAKSGDELYMKYNALLIVDDWLIIVGAIATFFIGIAYGIFTNWGFFKHRWITVKWVITIAMILYGTFVYHPVLIANKEMANTLRNTALTNAELLSNDNYMFISGLIQFSVLLFAVVISVLKPWKKSRAK